MDFKKLQENVLKFKKGATKVWKSVLEYSTTKLAESSFTLKNKKELFDFIEKSKSTSIIDVNTWKKKLFSHRVVVIFLDIKSDFFTQMLYNFPVLQTKAFSQNMRLKLADISMKGGHRKSYNISSDIALVVFENSQYLKTVEGKENIQNLVKSLSLDINKAIDEL